MNIVYVGDFLKKNGPSNVDIHITDGVTDQLKKVQINRKFSVNDWRRVRGCEVVNVSGVSMKGCLYVILARILGKKVTMIEHGSLALENESKHVPKIRLYEERIQIALSHQVICVSQLLQQRMENMYKSKKFCFINNGVDIIEKGDCIPKEKNTIMTVGGGRPEKGVLNVCRAVEAANKKRRYDDQLTLYVAGEDGEDTNDIKAFPFVKYSGFLPHKQLIDLMKKSDIYVQNSIFDSFGITILEAYQCDCKMIISTGCGVPIHFSNIVHCNDVGEIERAILSAEKEEMHVNMNEFSWSKSIRRYETLWRHLVDEGSDEQ